MIDLETDYKLGKLLGKGSYGKVYQATKNKKPYAIKLISLTKESLSAVLTREIASWKRISKSPNCSPYIVCLYDYGVTEHKNKPYISLVMEYIPDATELFEFYWNMNESGINFTLDQYKQIFHSLVKGLQYMHSKKVYHRDIKPENIIIYQYIPLFMGSHIDYRVKYIDFGWSCIKDTPPCEEHPATPEYASPEYYKAVADGKKMTDKELIATDIYALGTTMYFLAGQHPYPKQLRKYDENNENIDELFKIINQKPEPLQIYDEVLAKQITNLVQLDINKRIKTFNTIK